MTRNKIACLVALALLGGCGYVSDQVAASAGSRTVTFDQVRSALDTFKGTQQYSQLAQQTSAREAQREFVQGYLTNLIREAVIRPAAAKKGVRVTQAEVDDALQKIKSNYPDEKSFEQAVSQQGLTIDQLTRLVRDQVLEDKLKTKVTANLDVTKSKLRNYYDHHRSKFTQLHVAHILVSSSDFKIASQIRDEVARAPADKRAAVFAKLAKTKSLDTQSGANGGDVGTFSVDQLQGNIQTTLRSLPKNHVSHPVSTSNGFEIFFMLDRGLEPFGQAKPQIEQTLTQTQRDAEWQRWLESRYRQENITVDPRFGTVDPKSLQVVNVLPQQRPGGAQPVPTPAPTGQPLPPQGG
jgi:foldase protein PrsA